MPGPLCTLLLAVALLGACTVSGSEWAGEGPPVSYVTVGSLMLHAAAIAAVCHPLASMRPFGLAQPGLQISSEYWALHSPFWIADRCSYGAKMLLQSRQIRHVR